MANNILLENGTDRLLAEDGLNLLSTGLLELIGKILTGVWITLVRTIT